MFEFDQQLYEIIFCACTSREEQEWRTDIHEKSCESEDEVEKGAWPTSQQSVLSLDIKTLGFVFGQPGTLTRRQSVQRAATVNSRRNGRQVIIRNTNSLKESGEPPAPESECLSRSQSLLSTHRIPILTPKRAERQRIETAMAEVWTRDRLPFPGMTGNRGSYLIQRSATSVMRKISKASMTTTSTKRTVSPYMSINENDSTPCPESVNGKVDTFLFEVQRRVSYRIAQIDGTSSPPRDHHASTSPSDHEELITSKLKPFSAASIAKEKNLAVSQRGHKSRMRSPVSTRSTSQGSGEPGGGKGRSHRSKTLLKAFSRDGIWSWFD